MNTPQDEEFYIGYLDKAPKGIGTFTRKVVFGLIGTAVAVSIALVLGQQGFYPSTFEFLQYRTFEGTLVEHPYPMLRVLRPGEGGNVPTYSHYYLVSEGKFGAQDATEGLDGQRVRLEGALIYRDDQVMIELKPGTLASTGVGERAALEERSLGAYTLTGEIVDSKCYLGVMNPGNHKPHRACAVRCISGGVPPMLFVKDDRGRMSYLLLQGAGGEQVNHQVLDRVAEPVEITGEVVQRGEVLILLADPSTYRRLSH